MNPQLLCVRGLPSRRRFSVEGEEAVLGRDEGLAVALALDGVSRQHARVQHDARGWWLEDLQSTNGTYLNGQRTRRARLRHLDVITLGRAVDLLFLVRDPAAATGVRRGIVRAALANEAGIRYEVAVGEATLGRAAACNLVIDHEAVSKRHALLERTVDQLVLRDLASANGTQVNGAAVQVAVLKDGDTVALAGVEPLKVSIEMGDVLSSSGARPALTLQHAAPYAGDWKTRYEWDAAEMAVIEAVRRGEVPPEVRTVQRRPDPIPVPVPVPESAPKPPPLPPKPKPKPKPQAPPPVPVPAHAPAPESVPKPSPEPPPIRSVHLRTNTMERTVTEPGSYPIGRSPEVALRFEDNTVSRRHATLVFGADRRTVEIRDEGAANGTFVNAAKLERATHALKDGDELRLGHLALRVRIKR